MIKNGKELGKKTDEIYIMYLFIFTFWCDICISNSKEKHVYIFN